MNRFTLVTSIIVFAALFWFASATSADLESQKTLAPEQLEILEKGDPEQSAKIARKCAKCHGKDGISDDDEVPHLAGQNPRYVFKQLWDYKHKNRNGGRIKRVANKLSPQEIANLTARFCASELPVMEDVEILAAPTLVEHGDTSRDIEACVNCHRTDGNSKEGDPELPMLAGMPYDYFVETMLSFKDGLRYNDPEGVMGKIANVMSEQEIESLAEYYLALGQRKRIPEEEWEEDWVAEVR